VAAELLPALWKTARDRKRRPVGGVISGFFGRLPGHQGALRRLFLLKAGLGPDALAATGVVRAVASRNVTGSGCAKRRLHAVN
jgi:hypothetical protein